MSFMRQSFRFLGFGDGCRIGVDRVYAMVHFRPANVPQAQMWLSLYREKHRIPPDYALLGNNLGVLCSNPSDDGVLNSRALTALLFDLVSAMNRIPGLLRFAHHRVSVPGTGVAETHSVAPIDAKELLRACYTVPNDGSQGPPAPETKIVIREGSASAAPMTDKTGAMTVPIQAATEAKEPLLDYAAAFSCLSALSTTGRPEHQQYVDAVRRLKHWSSVVVTPQP